MVTFLALSIDPNQLVKTTSTTLAVGVIVDAVVIRALLVPALVSLMGRWNWWMPAGLARLLPAQTARSSGLAARLADGLAHQALEAPHDLPG
jgi:RND superfamily putative drug exporter